ncbi:uncharacterized protein N7511_008982 [Penicillium nucicola]|uniref:uncharacterized protein n=1 Tax=Penicillium nucicola TaxID=1850975 RepID=UPI0025450991|nr:uncharacterized protein N7511_008982 [Penicillium nucicola]KAJ5747286.1 hypothetical protein N7511_008982 [Penicillium nucicola]
MSQEASQKVNHVLSNFGRSPLHNTSLSASLDAAPGIVLAMTIDALIKARSISHELTQRTIKKLIKAGYHDINILKNSSWEDRVSVLANGGYSRHREQCATNLGGWQSLFRINMVSLCSSSGLAITYISWRFFFNNVESVWPCIAPFIDSRSLKTAVDVGIGEDLPYIYSVLKEDPARMSWFANGLSEVRLEKKQDLISDVM